jgi:hypothetical protein
MGETMARGTDSAIQRLQVGLVGLLVVLLFVSVANMLSNGAGIDTKSGSAEQSQTGQKVGKDAVIDEPLGELGVTPVLPEEADKQAAKNAAPAPAKIQP